MISRSPDANTLHFPKYRLGRIGHALGSVLALTAFALSLSIGLAALLLMALVTLVPLALGAATRRISGST